VLATGIYLLFFYRIGTPYESVVAITGQVWAGRWIRALHRYASDAIVVAAVVHAFRVFAQGRTWGPRALAWVSGLVLALLVMVCGWSGYVMVWDTQGLVLAREGARFLDALPLFAEPIGRAFIGDGDIPRAFFFLNLFLHVAVPVGMAVGLWIHVARAARPSVLPPPTLSRGLVVALLVMSVVWPSGLGPPADVFRLPGSAPFDAFYAFWLPLTSAFPAGFVWIGAGVVCAMLVAVPWLTRRPAEALPPSRVNEKLCDACRQCYLDCPYEAISMVEHHEGRASFVARVDPALCVSCGICAGSCAPMGVGPPGRTGRDQLARVREFITAGVPGRRDVVIVACGRGSGGVGEDHELDGARVFAVDCVGSLHTSLIEFLVRSGVGGVLVASCPPRDCWSREGPHWLDERLHHNREAELKPRVDRRRVKVVYAAYGERGVLRSALVRYREEVAALGEAVAEQHVDIDTDCDYALEGQER